MSHRELIAQYTITLKLYPSGKYDTKVKEQSKYGEGIGCCSGYHQFAWYAKWHGRMKARHLGKIRRREAKQLKQEKSFKPTTYTVYK